MANIIDGKEIAKQVRREVRQKAAQFAKAHGRAPGLAVILVGDDPASCIYVSNKQKACEKVGIAGQTLRLPEKTSTEELIVEIERLNRDPATDGILVQLPLPRHIDEKAALELMEDTDKKRRQYHNSHSERKWGDSRAYDLCINSSHLGVDKTAEIIESYIREALKK